MKKALIPVLILMTMVVLWGITACSPPLTPALTPPDSSSPTAPPLTNASDIFFQSFFAMSRMKTYKLDTTVIHDFRVTSHPDSKTDFAADNTTTTWRGTRSVDMYYQRLYLNMDIQAGPQTYSFERYFIWDHEYLRQTEPVPFLNGTPDTSWHQTRNGSFPDQAQMMQHLNFLHSAVKYNLLSEEKIDGVDCYVVDTTPSNEAVADWVVSQDQQVGPSLKISHGGPNLVGKGNFFRFNKGSRVTLWIAKDSFLVLKSEIDANFSAAFSELGREPGPDGADTIISSFQGRFQFSDYNRPLDIQPPAPDTLPPSPAPTNGVNTSEYNHVFDNLQGKLTFQEMDTFAGMINNGPTMTVLFTRNGLETIRKYVPDQYMRYIQSGTAEVSLAELIKTQNAAIASFRSLGIDESSDVDIRANRVMVWVNESDRPRVDEAVRSGQLSFPDYVDIITLEKPDTTIP